MDYRLGPLLVKNHDTYLAASIENERLIKLWDKDKGKDMQLFHQMFQVGHARIEAGVVTLLAATSLLEQVLYEFACRYMHSESYEFHLDRLKLETRWILLPKLCAGIVVAEDAPEINDLRQLIKARNVIVHPKVQFMRADSDKMPNVDKELARFHIACKNARRTVDSLFAVLNKSVKPPIDPACLI